jgi:hypothetical protein
VLLRIKATSLVTILCFLVFATHQCLVDDNLCLTKFNITSFWVKGCADNLSFLAVFAAIRSSKRRCESLDDRIA